MGHSYWTRPYKFRRMGSPISWRKSFRQRIKGFFDEDGEPILPAKIRLSWPMKHCDYIAVSYQYLCRTHLIVRKGKKWFSTKDHQVKGEKERRENWWNYK